jgi:hypothetical protein
MWKKFTRHNIFLVLKECIHTLLSEKNDFLLSLIKKIDLKLHNFLTKAGLWEKKKKILTIVPGYQ